MSKNQFFLFLAISLVILPFSFLFSWPDNKAYLIACNVGQGDALLITRESTQILIDGGPNSKVLECLANNMPFWDKEIELMINTHPEKDHLAGLVAVLDRYQVDKIVANSLVADSDVFRSFLDKVRTRQLSVYSPQLGDKIKIGEIELDTLWPRLRQGYGGQADSGNMALWQDNAESKVLGEEVFKGKLNEKSLVFHLRYGNFDAILTGDIDEAVEKQIIKDNQFSSIEVLKVAHHGSKYSSSEEFLEAVKPQTAIISVGKNSYGHPTLEVLDRLKQLNIKVLRTDQEEVKIVI
jgi:competence protein ComEC